MSFRKWLSPKKSERWGGGKTTRHQQPQIQGGGGGGGGSVAPWDEPGEEGDAVFASYDPAAYGRQMARPATAVGFTSPGRGRAVVPPPPPPPPAVASSSSSAAMVVYGGAADADAGDAESYYRAQQKWQPPQQRQQGGGDDEDEDDEDGDGGGGGGGALVAAVGVPRRRRQHGAQGFQQSHQYNYPQAAPQREAGFGAILEEDDDDHGHHGQRQGYGGGRYGPTLGSSTMTTGAAAGNSASSRQAALLEKLTMKPRPLSEYAVDKDDVDTDFEDAPVPERAAKSRRFVQFGRGADVAPKPKVLRCNRTACESLSVGVLLHLECGHEFCAAVSRGLRAWSWIS